MLEGEGVLGRRPSRCRLTLRWSEAEGREAAELSLCLLAWFNEVV